MVCVYIFKALQTRWMHFIVPQNSFYTKGFLNACIFTVNTRRRLQSEEMCTPGSDIVQMSAFAFSRHSSRW